MQATLSLVAILVSALLASPASAVLSVPFDTFTFQGQVTLNSISGTSTGGDFLDSATVGEVFGATVRLRQATNQGANPGDLNPDPSVGEYPEVAYVDFLGPDWSVQLDPVRELLTIVDASIDTWRITGVQGVVCGATQCTALGSLELLFQNLDGSAIASDNFPWIGNDAFAPFDVAAWDLISGSVDYRDGRIEFSAVPEPATSSLLLVAVAGIVASARTRHLSSATSG